MKKIVVLTGAGISAESGIKTFRDAGGLWEGHDIMEVASPQGFLNNPALVLDFYNKRRKQLLQVVPNHAHLALRKLEDFFNVTIITQNVDDLHERAGSTQVLHLHGELLKARCTGNHNHMVPWHKDMQLGDQCEDGHQLRPHIVWFGEDVPLMGTAIELTKNADIMLIVGTSLQVYPAASLLDFLAPQIPIYLIDPNPSGSITATKNLTIIAETASIGVPNWVNSLIDTVF